MERTRERNGESMERVRRGERNKWTSTKKTQVIN